MVKIRDLGITAIPTTLRPPEIGAGAWQMGGACGCCSQRAPNITTPKPRTPARKDKKEKKYAGFSESDVSQLRRQLNQHIDGEIVN